MIYIFTSSRKVMKYFFRVLISGVVNLFLHHFRRCKITSNFLQVIENYHQSVCMVPFAGASTPHNKPRPVFLNLSQLLCQYPAAFDYLLWSWRTWYCIPHLVFYQCIILSIKGINPFFLVFAFGGLFICSEGSSQMCFKIPKSRCE